MRNGEPTVASRIGSGRTPQRLSKILARRSTSQLLVVVFLIFGWELFGRSVQSPLLPPITAILAAWGDLILKESFQRDLGVSVVTMAIGFSLALVSGILLGIAMARFRSLEKLLDPYINAIMSSPISALVPIIMLIFGLQITARVVVVFLFSFFVICVNTLTGVKNADRSLVEMARSFGATDRDVARIVALPGALPMILGGVRLGIARAVGGVLIAELLMALSGLGYQLAYYGAAFLTAYVYAIVVTITLMAWVLTEAVQLLERRLTYWART
jgi:NitT/TauT family transport system permease protein